MSAAHEAVDAVQFLVSTGAATDLARTMGEAFAQGFAREVAEMGKRAAAAPMVTDALHAIVKSTLYMAIDAERRGDFRRLFDEADAALRAAGRIP